MSATPELPAFALGTYARQAGRAFAGVLVNDQVIPLIALRDHLEKEGINVDSHTSILDVLDDWEKTFHALEATLAELGKEHYRSYAPTVLRLEELRVLPPVNLPRQVFCTGANYFKHVVDILVDQRPGELPGTEHMDKTQLRAFAVDMMTKRRLQGEPYFFSKPVSAVSGALDPIRIPPLAKKPDWELELGVVMGKAARRVPRAHAMEFVAGYTIVNDISDRTLLWRRDELKAMGTDWIAGKSAPTYLPTGPYLLPSKFVARPDDLRLTLRLNGEIKQNESTSDMIFDIPRLIEYLSAMVQLMPGDVICTGSPAGNGTHFNRFLQPGDVIEASISGLGFQRNEVVAEVS